MKQAIIILIVCALALGVYLILKPAPPLETAREAEAAGDYRAALEGYSRALREMTDSRDIPNINRAKILSPAEWFKEMEQWIHWTIPATGGQLPPDLIPVIAAFSRCTTKTPNENIIVQDTTYPLDTLSMQRLWYTSFFPAQYTVAGDHSSLIQETLDNDLSLLRLVSQRDFAYRIHLVDIERCKTVTAWLYPESSVTFPVAGGQYLLISTSEVTFPDGAVWRSGVSVCSLEIPDTASHEQYYIRTRVHRSDR